MLTSSHVNKTLVLRIYLLSLPRKSEKSVKIGNRKPYEEPLIWGGHPGRDIRREQVGGTHLPPYAEPSRECISPPQQGAMGPGPTNPLGMVPMAPKGMDSGTACSCLAQAHGTPSWGGNTAWERLVGGSSPPMAPLYIHL